MSSVDSRLLVFFMAAMVCSAPIELSKIRYRFTTCGQTGRRGPIHEMCLAEYKNSTILAERNTFFFFDEQGTSTEHFQGGQGFRIPFSGRYNLSVAGAAGGRGLCNTDYGRGLLWKGQANFESGEELLILVGQKGRSPCDNENFPGLSEELCLSPPQNENESAVCNLTWYSNLLNSVPDNEFNIVYDNIGGGGGGGASVIRLVNHTSQGPVGTQFPIVVAPGGGGSAAITNYSVINQTLESFPANSTFRDEYQLFLDAKHALYDPQDIFGLGKSGKIYDYSIFRGGTGGGYLTLRDSANVDGGYLNAEENFAEGGFDCARQLFELYTVESPHIYGGFGGGGGQCGCGGSGGGFSGGRSTGTDHLLPGQGGYYYYIGGVTNDEQDASKRELTETGYQLNEFDAGYVEFVLEDCGCADLCTVNEEADTFECHCLDNETALAPNGFDCVKDIVADLSPDNDEPAVLVDQITFTAVHLNESISILATISSVSINSDNNTTNETVSCCMVFLGAHAEPVLATNIIRSSGILDSLAVISSDADGTLSLSEYHQVLSRPVIVTGGFFVSEGNCQLLTDHINFTISSHNVSEIPITTDVLVRRSKSDLRTLAHLVLDLKTEEITTETPPPLIPSADLFGSNSEVVWSLIGVSAVCIVVLTCGLTITAIRCTYKRIRRRKKRKQLEESQRPLFITSTSSMVPNTFYYAYRSTVNGEGAPFRNLYVPTRPPQRIEPNEGYEVISYSNLNGDRDPVTSSARHFPTKFGVNAPVHDFTAYNRNRVGTRAHCWEYPRNKLVYLRELGEGQFGKVLLMKANGIANYKEEIPVAVKTLSCRAPNMLEKFIQETNLMKKFCHPNIVSLLGVSSHDVNEDSAPLMILEYMPYGDLHGFLVKNRPQSSEHSMMTPAHFFSMGRDVAEALHFLSSQGYVHRDIAARNCLVGPDLCIKIADFGLAREVISKNYYKVEGNSVLPLKWMAPESLLFGVFTTASDVWSYGVLLWEVVTFGELPFDDLATEDIIQMAENKTLVHPRPPNCPEEIFAVIGSCHQDDPKQRIRFDEILTAFSKDQLRDDYFKQC